jgi:hypothetical protein
MWCGIKVKCTYIIHARNRKNNRALITTITFVREELNDNNADNDFYVIENENDSFNF